MQTDRIDEEVLQVEELDDAPLPPRRVRPKRPVAGRAIARLLGLLGLAGVLGGIVVALAPIVRLPVTVPGPHLGGLLLAGAGLVLFTLSGVRRGQIELAQRDDEALQLEQIGTDVVQLREAVARSQQETTIARNELRAVAGQVQALAAQEPRQQGQEASPESADVLQDALFRLAASLDQLGARIEKRMHVHNLTLQDRLEEFHHTVVSSHASLRELLVDERGMGHHEHVAAREREPAPAAEEPQPTHEEWNHEHEHEHPDADAYAAPLPNGSLGLLDQLDATGRRAPSTPAAPAPAAPQVGGIPGSLPARRSPRGTWEEELEMVAADSTGHDVEVDEKLHQLSQLLSDERLRNALDQMRRAAPGG